MQKKSDKSKIMFVRVPKTASSSIYSVLHKNYHSDFLHKRNVFFNHHDPLFTLSQMNDIEEFFKFSVVRNPYTRAYSHYKSFLVQLKMNDFNITNFSFNDFLKYVRTKGSSLYSTITLNRNPYSIFDQCFYLMDDFGEFGLDKIYRFENLKEFEEDFSVQLPKFKVSDTTRDEYLFNYNDQNIGLVKSLYYRDFSLLNYSFNFNDSIEGVGIIPPP